MNTEEGGGSEMNWEIGMGHIYTTMYKIGN